jgi:CBS domain containing-hemolysin-like protein
MTKLLLVGVAMPGLGLLVLLSLAASATLPSPGALVVPAVVVLLLVLLNGLFVAAEFSIIGVRPSQLEQMAEEGHKTAKTVLNIVTSREKQDQYIATSQLGITIASLGLAMYAEPQIAHFIEPYLALLWFEPSEALVRSAGYVIALSFLTYLHIVVGEMVPKALALTDPAHMVIWLNRPMQIIQKFLIIPVRILNGMGNQLLRLFQIPLAEGHARVLSPEELELIVSESAEGGMLNEEEELMIRNIFDFGERLVGQVMTPRLKVEAIPLEISREELLHQVAESHHSRFPVYKGDRDHIIGILHVKDLVRQILRAKGNFDLRLLLRPAPAVPEDQGVEVLLAIFRQQRLHMAVALDEFGGMAGIVTLEDLVEEIVGEVRDEFDTEREPFVEISPGVLEVDGEYLVDDLKDVVFLGDEDRLPDVETVGGLIVTKLGRPPLVGDMVTYDGEGADVSMKVLAAHGRAVVRVRIEFDTVGKIEEEADQ